MSTPRVAVIAHAGKSLGGGLAELRRVLTERGVPDPFWREVAKSRFAPRQVDKALARGCDLLLVWGGDVLYLCHWMRQSGLADLLPSLHETVYVGVSSGSMVLTPNFGEAYDGWFCREPPASDLPAGDDRALGVVDFSFFPHLDHERSPENSLANAERWAAGIPVPTYAIDDQSAIKVTDGAVEVVSEGHWKLFTP